MSKQSDAYHKKRIEHLDEVSLLEGDTVICARCKREVRILKVFKIAIDENKECFVCKNKCFFKEN